MAMISRLTENNYKNNPLQTESVWDKLNKQQDDDKEKNSTIGKAAEVFISAAGKKLAAENGNPLSVETSTAFDTPSESKISQKKREAAEREEYKKQAAEIETQIAEDTSLSSDDKADLQKQADELWEKGKTDEDRLHDYYQAKRDIHKDLEENGDSYNEEDMTFFATQLDTLDQQIKAINDPLSGTLHREAMEDESLEMSAIRERSNITLMRNKAKIQNQTLDERSSDAAMTIRTPEQVAAQATENSKVQPTSEDVIHAAVSEGQERAEKADDETERLSANDNSATLAQTTSHVLNNTDKLVTNDITEKENSALQIRLNELNKKTE